MSSLSQAITIQGIIQENLDSERITFQKIQKKIKQELNIDVSIESLKHMFYLSKMIDTFNSRTI